MTPGELDMMAFVRRVGAAAVRKQATKPWPANIIAVLAHTVLELDRRMAVLERAWRDAGSISAGEISSPTPPQRVGHPELHNADGEPHNEIREKQEIRALAGGPVHKA